MAKDGQRGAVTRFAPSPTGFLHLGHAYSALFAGSLAGEAGRFLLRIEDIDRGRCRPEYEAAIYRDLEWLGLGWEAGVRRQSEHMDDYARALETLDGAGLLYPCFCTRAAIRAEIERSGAAPHGPDGPVYPGICRGLPRAETQDRIAAGEAHALRLDMARAAVRAGPLAWHDRDRGKIDARPEIFGDVVLARKDTPDQLSSRGHRRRPHPGNNPGDPRRGPAARNPRAPAAAGATGVGDTGIPASPAADRRYRSAPRQAARQPFDPVPSGTWAHQRGGPGDGRVRGLSRSRPSAGRSPCSPRGAAS